MNNEVLSCSVIDFIYHYFRKGTRPFQSLSVLSEEQAKSMMKSLFIPGSMLWQRFGSPDWYLSLRRQVESELYSQFKAKGGSPRQAYPIYFTVGRPKWAVDSGDPATIKHTAEIRVPFSLLRPQEVSLTYPDSMLSFILHDNQDHPEYKAEYHGKVFMFEEMESLIKRDGLPVHDWKQDRPPHFSHYVEVQVWNQAPLEQYLKRHGTGS